MVLGDNERAQRDFIEIFLRFCNMQDVKDVRDAKDVEDVKKVP